MGVSGGTVVFDSSSKTLFNLQSIRTYLNKRETLLINTVLENIESFPSASDVHGVHITFWLHQLSITVCCTEALFVGHLVIWFFFTSQLILGLVMIILRQDSSRKPV